MPLPDWCFAGRGGAFLFLCLVILDVLTDFSGAADLNRAEVARAFMQNLRRIAADTDTAILGVTHNRKGNSSDTENLSDLVAGSGQLVAVAKSVIAFLRVDEDTAVIETTKYNYAPSVTREITFNTGQLTYSTGETRPVLNIAEVVGTDTTLREEINALREANSGKPGSGTKSGQRARQLVELLEANGGGMWHEDICESLRLSSSGKANFSRVIRKASPPVVSVKTEQGKFWVAFENVPAPVSTSSTHQLINPQGNDEEHTTS